jgi:hypothetical protein
MKIVVGLFIGLIGLYVGAMAAVVVGSDTMSSYVPTEQVYQEDIGYGDGSQWFPSYEVQHAIGVQQ